MLTLENIEVRLALVFCLSFSVARDTGLGLFHIRLFIFTYALSLFAIEENNDRFYFVLNIELSFEFGLGYLLFSIVLASYYLAELVVVRLRLELQLAHVETKIDYHISFALST